MEKRAVTDADVRATDGYSVYIRTNVRWFSVRVFEENADELISFIKSSQDFHNRLAAEDGVLDPIQRKTNRFLHNFLAAAKTLVDHSRKFVEEFYEGTELQREYKKRVVELIKTGPVKFVNDLRSYMLHRSLPPIEMTVSLDGSATFALPSLAFEGNKTFTTDARTYIDSCGGQIDILQMAEEYRRLILDFHHDFDALIMATHADELEHMSELIKEVTRQEALRHGGSDT